ncbi:shikimate kinase [Aquabacterium olei]|uniref:Shikimate kinase n=1 Tax=Aquabacterium olei TaxID=1296669 RepID=A0A2U8FTA0_9BURK|nr:shikimate kinase [Aquabacterium olei]AWI54240.1 shikimate kinase [Aquabacterium olei]
MVSVVSLVGLPGGGKTTVGRQLARRLGARFVDADHVLEERLGMPIRAFFEQHGEPAFRDLEERVIDELTAHTGEPLVLATGGGAVLRAPNRAHLRDRTTVVYLRSTPEELFRRLRHDTQRPLLQVADPLSRLRDLHAQRHPLYEQTAHFCVDTGRPSVSMLVGLILSQLEQAGCLPHGEDHVGDHASGPSAAPT